MNAIATATTTTNVSVVDVHHPFDASISVTDLLMKTLENSTKSFAIRCLTEAANRHGFDLNEEVRSLGLEQFMLHRKQMERKPKEPKEKAARTKKSKPIPMPFLPDYVCEEGCNGLVFNRGLFTQCPKSCVPDERYCAACFAEVERTGAPECGTVAERLALGLYEFKDPKGRKPVLYTKLLTKWNVTPEQAKIQAASKQMFIPEEHFTAVASSRGRPKKTVSPATVPADDAETIVVPEPETSVLQVPEPDVLSKMRELDELFEDDIDDENNETVEFPDVDSVELKEAEQAAKKALKETQKAAEKAKKEAEKAAEKAKKEAEKAAEKAKKEAEKAASKAEKTTKKVVAADTEQHEGGGVVAAAKKVSDYKKFEEDGVHYYLHKPTGVVMNKDKERLGVMGENKKIEFDM